jgi:hypothetical protein
MTVTPKQLLIDKDVFEGTKQNDLYNFVKNHFLILPEVLLYECLTTKRNKNFLVHRFEQVILMGGYICPATRVILQKEATNLCPLEYLTDLKMTTDMRTAVKRKKISYNSKYLSKLYRKDQESADLLIDLAKSTATTVLEKEPQATKEARRYEESTSERYQLWIVQANNADIHTLAVEKLAHLTNSPKKYCLSEDWVTWHYLRLMSVLSVEYGFLIGKGGEVGRKRATHDLLDMEYVLLLSRADGILTRDEKLVKPLTHAAFPDKDVFSELNEVPDEYLCNWS